MAAYSSPTACGSVPVKPTAEKSPLASASASAPAAASSAVPESLPPLPLWPESSGAPEVHAVRAATVSDERRQVDEDQATTHGDCLPNGPM